MSHPLPSLFRRSKQLFYLCLAAILLSGIMADAQSACVAGSGTCADAFTSSISSLLTEYSTSWQKVNGSGDAYITGNSTVAIAGLNYAYYVYSPSKSDTSQITVSPSSTSAYYAREACVRLSASGGYCVGFGAVKNGAYDNCFVEKGGTYMSSVPCGALPSALPHTLAIVASGAGTVKLSVFVDGAQLGTLSDSDRAFSGGQPGLGLIGDGTAANSQVAGWQDYLKSQTSNGALISTATPAACPTGTGSCYDNFVGQANLSVTQYNPMWTRNAATSEAFLTATRSVQIPGYMYAYYSYTASGSDTSQITVSPSGTSQAYTREACVRLQPDGGGYCVGFGPVRNGVYENCFIEKQGSYLGNVSCGYPSAGVSHKLALVASGIQPAVLQVYLDGVPVRALVDSPALPTTRPGFALIGNGVAAYSDMSAWRDYREVATATAPTFSPASGSYNGAQWVTINSGTSNAVVHYTVDGSTPTALSPVYSSPVLLSTSTTLKALSMARGQATSAVASSSYQIILPPAPAPYFSVPSPYNGPGIQVGIASPIPGAQIQFCVDSSNTCTPSAMYTGPINFASTSFIRARVMVNGFWPSAVTVWQGTYNSVYLTTTTCPAGAQYQQYQGCILKAAGGLPPYTFGWSTTAADGLPEGLNLNPQTGLISGKVNGQGVYHVSFTVTDGTGNTVSQVVPIAMAGDNTTGGCSFFPADSIWHLNIANLPVDASPAGPIPPVYQASAIHLVFGANLSDGGIPFFRVSPLQPYLPVTTTQYQSYFTSAPIPLDAPVESTQNAVYGDRHVSVLQTGGNGSHCKLWEMFQGTPTANGGWTDSSNAYWDLESYDMLPQDNGSTDAAGLPIAPLLYNYDEVAGNCAAGAECGVVKHAGRLTLNHTLAYHVWPATAQSGLGHCSGGYQDDGHLLSQSNPPTACSSGVAMGEIQRLKSSTATPAACVGHPQALVIIKAMRNYGLMVVDNGITGGVVATADSRWNNDDLACLTNLRLSDFEPVNVSSKMVDINSSKVLP